MLGKNSAKSGVGKISSAGILRTLQHNLALFHQLLHNPVDMLDMFVKRSDKIFQNYICPYCIRYTLHYVALVYLLFTYLCLIGSFSVLYRFVQCSQVYESIMFHFICECCGHGVLLHLVVT